MESVALETIHEKIVAIYVLTAVPLVGGLLPLLAQDVLSDTSTRRNLRNILNWLLCLSEGTLLATCCMYLIPSMVFKMNFNTGGILSFPLDVTILSFGFFCVYFFEETVSNVVKIDLENAGAMITRNWMKGLAIGVQSTSTSVWVVLSVVTFYNTIFMSDAGLDCIGSNQPMLVRVIYIILLAIIPPGGIIVGGSLFNELVMASIDFCAMFVLQATIIGGLFYIALAYVLNREQKMPLSRLVKVCLKVIGFKGMAIVIFITLINVE